MQNEKFHGTSSFGIGRSRVFDVAIPLVALPSLPETLSLFLNFVFVVLFSDQHGVSVSTRVLLTGLLISASFCNYVCTRNMRQKIDAVGAMLGASDGTRTIDIALF